MDALEEGTEYSLMIPKSKKQWMNEQPKYFELIVDNA